jgi:LPS export ABC transporter protein LptC
MKMRFVGLALFASLALAACQGESTSPAAVADAAELPADQVIYGLRHNMSKDGIRTGVLRSDTAFLFEAGRKLDLRAVELRFYGDTGAETGKLTSRTGEYDIATGSFVARGDAVLITQGPEGERRLETEELHYDVRRDELWSDAPFVLRENGRVTEGQSFRSDSRFRTWSVSGARTEGGLPQNATTGISF